MFEKCFFWFLYIFPNGKKMLHLQGNLFFISISISLFIWFLIKMAHCKITLILAYIFKNSGFSIFCFCFSVIIFLSFFNLILQLTLMDIKAMQNESNLCLIWRFSQDLPGTDRVPWQVKLWQQIIITIIIMKSGHFLSF